MIRRYGEPRRGDKSYRLRPGAYAVLMRGTEVLMTWQGAPHFEYQLPGGGIDPGETPVTALYREVYEETGWHIGRPRRIGAFRRFGYMPEYDLWAEKLCHIFLARPARRIGPPVEADHLAVWMEPASAVATAATAGERAFLRYALSSTGPV